MKCSELMHVRMGEFINALYKKCLVLKYELNRIGSSHLMSLKVYSVLSISVPYAAGRRAPVWPSRCSLSRALCARRTRRLARGQRVHAGQRWDRQRRRGHWWTASGASAAGRAARSRSAALPPPVSAADPPRAAQWSRERPSCTRTPYSTTGGEREQHRATRTHTIHYRYRGMTCIIHDSWVMNHLITSARQVTSLNSCQVCSKVTFTLNTRRRE